MSLPRYQQFVARSMQRAFETGRVLRYLVVSVTVVVVASGFLMWLIDRKDFPSLGLALWWAVGTVTTVGYGDVVPTQPWGRLVAAVLMIVGFASLSLLTGIVASLLVQRQAASQAESVVDRVEARLDEVERLLRDRPS